MPAASAPMPRNIVCRRENDPVSYTHLDVYKRQLQICRTDIGGGDIRDIVCGGTNVRPGMKVAVAAPRGHVPLAR